MIHRATGKVRQTPSVDQCLMASYAIDEIFNLSLKEKIDKFSELVERTRYPGYPEKKGTD